MRCLWAALLFVGLAGRAEDVGYPVFDPLTQTALATGVVGIGAGIAIREAFDSWQRIDSSPSCLSTCCATTKPLFKFSEDLCLSYNAQRGQGGKKLSFEDPERWENAYLCAECWAKVLQKLYLKKVNDGARFDTSNTFINLCQGLDKHGFRVDDPEALERFAVCAAALREYELSVELENDECQAPPQKATGATSRAATRTSASGGGLGDRELYSGTQYASGSNRAPLRVDRPPLCPAGRPARGARGVYSRV